jgi:class 3 adenylate cyclase
VDKFTGDGIMAVFTATQLRHPACWGGLNA